VSQDQLYLRHVLDAIGTIQRYVAVGHDEFMTATHWQDAVIRQLEIIGEAIKCPSARGIGIKFCLSSSNSIA
jgi:uncharacterized protein with HEPN domain